MNRYGLKLMKDEQQVLRARYNDSENKYEKQIISDILTIMRDYETNYKLATAAADCVREEMSVYYHDMDPLEEDSLERVVGAVEQYRMLKENLDRTETALRDMKNMLAYADMRP